MKLEKIITDPAQALQYMERLVNNGSPSKFTFENMARKEYNPFFSNCFNLCYTTGVTDDFVIWGNEYPEILNNNVMLLHPEWKNCETEFEVLESDYLVTPTSSTRTVKVLGEDIYLKLYYPGILGRISRELTEKHILSSLDVTKCLSRLVDMELVPDVFSFFPENCGKLLRKNSREIGYVIRSAIPYGKKCKYIKYMIPAFSLFSKDRENDDLPLIIQILNYKNVGTAYILDQLIFPLIDCYFMCVFNGGIQLELHSQNFLIGFDENFNVVSFIIRDLESADKDLAIMNQLGSPILIQSKPFKCINTQDYNYKIKHSFMFDHKFGEYFLDEFLYCLVRSRGIDIEKIQQQIKEYVNMKFGERLSDFFPEDGRWYKFARVLIDQTKSTRPYIACLNPKYR